MHVLLFASRTLKFQITAIRDWSSIAPLAVLYWPALGLYFKGWDSFAHGLTLRSRAKPPPGGFAG
jgi:hypothetical protein